MAIEHPDYFGSNLVRARVFKNIISGKKMETTISAKLQTAVENFAKLVDVEETVPRPPLYQSIKQKYEQFLAQQESENLKDMIDRAVRPWNLSDYQSRLMSFKKTSHWFAKPKEISPQQCARHGWRNTGIDTLTCLACAKSVVCKGSNAEILCKFQVN